MVQVKTAGYGFTRNTGNYESYRVYLGGSLDEGESYLDAIANLIQKNHRKTKKRN